MQWAVGYQEIMEKTPFNDRPIHNINDQPNTLVVTITQIKNSQGNSYRNFFT